MNANFNPRELNILLHLSPGNLRYLSRIPLYMYIFKEKQKIRDKMLDLNLLHFRLISNRNILSQYTIEANYKCERDVRNLNFRTQHTLCEVKGPKHC